MISDPKRDGAFNMVAYFAFKEYQDTEFIFELNNEDKIAHARRIISGEENEECM